MAREINRPENRGYADNGVAEYKEAAARFMERNFGVKLDPATEVNHCIGSKTALAMLPAAFINPGDVTLMTVPGYPVAGTHTKYYGGTVHRLPLMAENDFFPDLEFDSGRRAVANEAAGAVLSEQPDGQNRDARFLQAGHRVCPEAQNRRHSRRRPRHAELRPPAA